MPKSPKIHVDNGRWTSCRIRLSPNEGGTRWTSKHMPRVSWERANKIQLVRTPLEATCKSCIRLFILSYREDAQHAKNRAAKLEERLASL